MKYQPPVAVWYYLPMLLFRGQIKPIDLFVTELPIINLQSQIILFRRKNKLFRFFIFWHYILYIETIYIITQPFRKLKHRPYTITTTTLIVSFNNNQLKADKEKWFIAKKKCKSIGFQTFLRKFVTYKQIRLRKDISIWTTTYDLTGP